MPQPLIPKKKKLDGSMMTYNLLELTNTKKKKKKCPFHHRGLEIKIGSQEIPGVTDKFGFGVQIEAGEKLREFFRRTHWS